MAPIVSDGRGAKAQVSDAGSGQEVAELEGHRARADGGPLVVVVVAVVVWWWPWSWRWSAGGGSVLVAVVVVRLWWLSW